MAGNPEKAKKYLALLDEARCNDRWSEVTELARKVGKHAPQRQCLVLVARTEAEQASRISNRPLVGALSKGAIEGLRASISKHEQQQPEDAYQARACLAQALWAADDKRGALDAISEELPPTSIGDTKERIQWAGWTYVAAVRSSYIKEVCLNSSDEHAYRHEDLFRILETVPVNVQKSTEYCAWIEILLTRLSIRRPKRPIWDGGHKNINTTERLLVAFRLWLRSWDVIEDRKPPTLAIEEGSRREVWAVYYSTLSQLLRSGYVYPKSPLAFLSKILDTEQSHVRLLQALELQRVEAVYENFLLKDTSFPEASKFNKEIDGCANQVMENWNVMCGDGWQEDELGPGGRESLTRRVADFLYRAATKTFHSCAILRHLFAIHASLGEFHLAAKALDTYLDIVLKGKARVAKSGKGEPTLDKDEAIVQTIVNGIEMHSSYGKVEQARRSEQLSSILQGWLPRREREEEHPSQSAGNSSDPEVSMSLQHSTLALIYRAIGISKANWAHYVLESSERSKLHAEATKFLQRSLSHEAPRADNPRTLYALALVLAETRDVEGAIANVKQALSIHTQLTSKGTEIDRADQHYRVLSRMGVSCCWHLLALLLSARKDFEKAEAACDAALQSFDNEKMSREIGLKQLSFFEKQQVIQTKLTQAALLEINSNVEDAINVGSDILRLYAYLFPSAVEKKDERDGLKSAAGTFRHGGSIFRRKKTVVESNPASTGPPSVYSSRLSVDTFRPTTTSTAADGNLLVPPATSHSHSQKLHKRPSKRTIPSHRPDTATTVKTTATVPALAPQINGLEASGADPQVGLAVSHDLPQTITSQLEELTTTNLPSLALADGQYNGNLQVNTSSRTPHSSLPPRFPSNVVERYSLGLLASIWIFISKLYRRAGLYDDSIGAIEEALKVVERVESISAKKLSSVKHFEELEWGGARSVEQLWADAHAESAFLHLAQQHIQDSMSKFETALLFFPDHSLATVGLSNLLLEFYSDTRPLSDTQSGTNGASDTKAAQSESSKPVLSSINALQHGSTHRRTASSTEAFPSLSPSDPGIAIASVNDADRPANGLDSQNRPKDQDKLAARDRAFGLLSSLTKLGSSWDDSEAWFALARAYEESRQPDKARDILWWVVELEEKKPVREWACLGKGYSC